MKVIVGFEIDDFDKDFYKQGAIDFNEITMPFDYPFPINIGHEVMIEQEKVWGEYLGHLVTIEYWGYGLVERVTHDPSKKDNKIEFTLNLGCTIPQDTEVWVRNESGEIEDELTSEFLGGFEDFLFNPRYIA